MPKKLVQGITTVDAAHSHSCMISLETLLEAVESIKEKYSEVSGVYIRHKSNECYFTLIYNRLETDEEFETRVKEIKEKIKELESEI